MTTVILENIVKQTLLFVAMISADFKEFYLELLAFYWVQYRYGLTETTPTQRLLVHKQYIYAIVSSNNAQRSIFRIHVVVLTPSPFGKGKVEEAGYDPLFKVCPLLDHLSAVFPSHETGV